MTDLSNTLASAVVWLNIIVGIFILIFGIVGNLGNIYVFTRPTGRNTNTTFYLLAASVASYIQILHTLVPRILSDGFQISIVQSNDRYCQSRFIISGVASLSAISYPCWASFDQFICTSRNAIRRIRWSSKRFVYQTIFLTVLLWSIIFLPGSISSRASANTCIVNNRILTDIYSYGTTPLGYCILPITFLTYFNIGIVKNLGDAPVVIVNNTSRRMAKQVHRMLVPQLIILILSGLPFATQTLYSVATASTVKSEDRVAIENLIGHITRLLFYLNYISAFYIYILTSSEFKKIVQNIFRKQVVPSLHGSVLAIPTG